LFSSIGQSYLCSQTLNYSLSLIPMRLFRFHHIDCKFVFHVINIHLYSHFLLEILCFDPGFVIEVL
jgi:hypothetical protein